jgi:excisionase family DNA binding protein
MPMIIGGKRLYSTLEVAKMLNISEVTVRNYIKKRYLRGQKFLNRWMFSEEDLMDFFRSLQ